MEGVRDHGYDNEFGVSEIQAPPERPTGREAEVRIPSTAGQSVTTVAIAGQSV